MLYAPQPKIRVVFLDLDGTLLSSRLDISDRNIRSLNQAADAGVQTVLVSGRPATSIVSFSQRISKSQYIIASNGGAVIRLREREVLSVSPIKRHLIDAVLGIAVRQNVSVCMYAPLEWFAKEITPQVQLEIDRSGTLPTLVSNFQNIHEPIVKLLLIGEKRGLIGCEEALSRELEAHLEWFYSYPEYLEIMPGGVSKGTACKFLMRILAVESQDILAVGDGASDVSMLACARIGVAVENGVAKLLSMADYITPSNDNDGVAAAIDAFVFEEVESASLIKNLTQSFARQVGGRAPDELSLPKTKKAAKGFPSRSGKK